jgi:hypothetical protein
MTAVFSKVVVLPEACLLGRVDPQDWVPETPPRIEVVAGVRPEMVDDGDGNAFDVQRIGIAFDVPQGAKNGSSNTGLPG